MKISHRCYAITGLSYITPWTVNAGFIVGDTRTLIVDTGANLLSAQTIYGYASSVRPLNTLLVINTEHHLDHISGNSYFRERGIDVYGHHKIARNTEELLADMPEINTYIPNAVRRENHEERIFFLDTTIANPNKPISGDTTLHLGNVEACIIMTPGHTPTNISIYIPADEVLFSGDCMISGYLPNLESGTCEDWQEWLGSLDKIAALAPEIVVPGHGQVLQGRGMDDEIHRIRLVLEVAIKTGVAPTLAEEE